MDKLSPIPNLNKHIYSSIDSDVHPGVLTIKKTKDRMLPALAKHNNHGIFYLEATQEGSQKP